MYYVYLLRSLKKNWFYIGYTDDLRVRFKTHNEGKNIATKPYAPFRLVYYEAYFAKQDAMKRELQLKRYKQAYSRLKERIPYSIKGQN